MTRLLLTILLIFSVASCLAQQDRYWCMPDSFAIDFGVPDTPLIATSLHSDYFNEALASIADQNGNLLFYLCYPPFIPPRLLNSDHDTIQNGIGIKIQGSATNGAIIIPKPNNNDQFYLFTKYIKNLGGGLLKYRLYYHLIDMTANGGNGTVVFKNVEVPLGLNNTQEIVERIGAVRHANGKDWWVITHGYLDSVFYKIKMNAEGIDSIYSQVFGNKYDTLDYSGEITFSPDGKRLAVTTNGGRINLFDFDRCTGIFSNFIQLDDGVKISHFDRGYYGCSFSPNSKVLYVSAMDTLIQYNLAAPNIKASKTILKVFQFSDCSSDTCHQFGQHQLAPNGKIYIPHVVRTGPSVILINNIDNQHLMVINQPDSLGFACDFQEHGLYVGNHSVYFGLPNFPNYNLGPDIISPTLTAPQDTTICPGEPANLQVPQQDSLRYHWSPATLVTDSAAHQTTTLPDTTTTFILTRTDTTVQNSCNTRKDTITVQVMPPPIAQFSLTTNGQEILCQNTTTNATTYHWTFGDGDTATTANPTHNYTSPGNYNICLIATNNCGFTDTLCQTLQITTINPSQPEAHFQVQVSPNPFTEQTIFHINNPTKAPLQFHLYNIIGQQVHQQNQITTTQFTLHRNQLPSGIYFYKFAIPNGHEAIGKLIIR